jgi:arginyl-tRNA synthetase
MVTDELAELIATALDRAAADGAIPSRRPWSVTFERPRRVAHGDWATNVALVIGGSGSSPRTVAEALVERIPDSEIVERIDVAGPGFLNFHLAPAWLHDVVRRAADPTAAFGRNTSGSGVEVNIEYVSPNPTHPASVVSGRHAAVGDAIANLLEATGHEVTRECYLNDSGRQMRLFARSVAARYQEAFGAPSEIPEDGYRGEYVRELAREIAAEIGDRLVDVDEDERVGTLGPMALQRMVAGVRASLERFGTRFDVWFSESRMHQSGEVAKAIERLRAQGWIEETDGALWFRTSRLGDDKDRVIVRSDGAPTYLAADVAYMLDKFERGFDRLIYLLGADHHGTLPRLRAAADALGFGRERIELPLVQNVAILRRGEPVSASSRAGMIVLLDDLVSEVGADAARYTFLTRSLDAPLDFDVELVKEQAPENPVYYVQYAHARISSILRKASAEGIEPDLSTADLARLNHPSEEALMRRLASYEEVVPEAAALRAPQKVAHFVETLASDFSGFYRDCRVVSEDSELTQARLVLCVATKTVIADALGLLSVTAPERM